ncbi:hypothetical protein EDD86DRAFT_245105 [Gorgonomyces haynaldii]|nr:hypothetical protein EDD86DRAFT_245105 [Gorgonomyces haynaldii]
MTRFTLMHLLFLGVLCDFQRAGRWKRDPQIEIQRSGKYKREANVEIQRIGQFRRFPQVEIQRKHKREPQIEIQRIAPLHHLCMHFLLFSSLLAAPVAEPVADPFFKIIRKRDPLLYRGPSTKDVPVKQKWTIQTHSEFLNTATLGDLVEAVSKDIQVPAPYIKLLHGGVLMSDHKKLLSGYNIQSGSKIMILGEQPKTVDKQRLVIEKLEGFATQCTQLASELKHDQQTLLRVGEMLLQTLLKIDSVEIEQDWEEARQKRRETVKLVQGFLEQVDKMKANL